jgi:hypothetical protein
VNSGQGTVTTDGCSLSSIADTIEFASTGAAGPLNKLQGKRLHVANTTKIEDKLERKKLKRAARKKAAPKAKRTTPRGSNKKKVKKLVRGQSKR